MTSDDSTLPASPPVPPVSPPSEPSPPAGGPRLGHVVLGAILVLVGVGWLLEALEAADVPWRYLLPSALIIVGAALAFGARTGRHGGLIAVGVFLTAFVLLAGAIEILVDIPLAGGIGDETRRPTTTVEDEYRWGLGKLVLDLRAAEALAGREIRASVVVGELLVLTPADVVLVVTAHSGVGEVVVLAESSGGFDTDLACVVSGTGADCGDGAAAAGEPALRLDLEVAIGKVEVRR